MPLLFKACQIWPVVCATCTQVRAGNWPFPKEKASGLLWFALTVCQAPVWVYQPNFWHRYAPFLDLFTNFIATYETLQRKSLECKEEWYLTDSSSWFPQSDEGPNWPRAASKNNDGSPHNPDRMTVAVHVVEYCSSVVFRNSHDLFSGFITLRCGN